MEKRFRRICLDTNVVIDYLRQTEDTEDLIERIYPEFDEITLTIITVYELLVGVEYSGGRDRAKVDAVIENSIILPLNKEASREAARISAELRKSGQQIGIADELIAAICVIFDACLLTKNTEHFWRIGNLKVIDMADFNV